MSSTKFLRSHKNSNKYLQSTDRNLSESSYIVCFYSFTFTAFQVDWVTQSNTAFIMFFSSLPMSNRMRKKMLKKTSYQKTKEEFETIKEKRRKKKEVMVFLFSVYC